MENQAYQTEWDSGEIIMLTLAQKVKLQNDKITGDFKWLLIYEHCYMW